MKAYIKPRTEVCLLAAHTMLNTMSADNNTKNALEEDEILSKRSGYTLWDDDFDEE